MHVLVTGSSGLIGSEAVMFFDALGFAVTGIDNNMRADFFGPGGDTTWNRQRLESTCKHFRHLGVDIRDRNAVDSLFRQGDIDLVIHAAAQPSHELASKRPLDDFDVNAVGTLNLLEAFRHHCPQAVFIHVSSNKVYGDGPNHIALKELETRWEYDDPVFAHGIPETFPIDRCMHSLFGVSKLASDVMAQEYGRYFGLKTGVFRGGCLTGPRHSGVELHGFLNYLVAVSLRRASYTVFGYKGKQVRDQIHSHDVVNAFWHFTRNPRPGEVYNIGGGHENAASILECIELIADLAGGRRPKLVLDPNNRLGDHICYYSDIRKLKDHFPQWSLSYSLPRIVEEIIKFSPDKVRLL